MDQPDVVATLRGDLTDWRQWMARVVVLAHAAAAGLAVVAFTWLSDRALQGFAALYGWHEWAPLVWTPAWTAGLAWLTRRYYPGATGSGIPQVMAALSPSTVAEERAGLVSLPLSIAKTVLTAGGLLGGLAIGREGPSVQIAAGIMQHARRWLPRTQRDHAAGAAGGRWRRRHRRCLQCAARRRHVRHRGAHAQDRAAQQRPDHRRDRAVRPDGRIGVRQFDLLRRHPRAAPRPQLRPAGTARGHRLRPARRLLLAAPVCVDRRRRQRSLQRLAAQPSGPLRCRVRPRDRADRHRQRRRDLRQRLRVHPSTGRRAHRHAAALRHAAPDRHLAGGVVGRAGRACSRPPWRSAPASVPTSRCWSRWATARRR